MFWRAFFVVVLGFDVGSKPDGMGLFRKMNARFEFY